MDFHAGRLYRLTFSLAGTVVPAFGPKNLRVLGGSYIVWGNKRGSEYLLYVFVLSEASPESSQNLERSTRFKASLANAPEAIQPMVAPIVWAILGVAGLGLGIALLKETKEILNPLGLGLTGALVLGFGVWRIFLRK